MDDIRALSLHVFGRTRARLEGLGDDEYLWEPVAGCKSVRLSPEGTPVADRTIGAGAPEFTTIAWRLWHLTTCYGDARNQVWLTGVDGGRGDERCGPRATAAEALDALERAARWWEALVSGLSDEGAAEPLGPVAGPFESSTKASFVLHQVDEMIHHGAEVGVLRDLYRSQLDR